MRTDNRSHILDLHIFHSVICDQLLFDGLCFLQTVPMTDKYGLLSVPDPFHQIFDNCLNRFFSAANLSDHFQFSFFIDPDDRLDPHHRTKYCTASGHSASTVKMKQIIHCHIRSDVVFIFLTPVSYFIHRGTLFFQLYCFIYKKSLTQSRQQRIDHDNFTLRILILQLFRCDPGTLTASA